MKYFLYGVFGGIAIIAVFLIVIFSCNLFNYNIRIINPVKKEVSENFSEKAKLMIELEKDGILLTPQEYTNNVVTYYNTALTILAAMIVLFSVISYFHLKFLSEKQIIDTLKKSLDTKEFKTTIKESIFGKAEEIFASVETADEIIIL